MNRSATMSPTTRTFIFGQPRTSSVRRSCNSTLSKPMCRLPRTRVLEHPFDSIEELLGDVVGSRGPRLTLVFELAPPVPGQDEHTVCPDLARHLDVAVFVADDIGRRQIDPVLARGAQEHPRARLPTFAPLPERRLAGGRMVRTVVDGVESRPFA